MTIEPEETIGRWTAYVAGPAIGWDMTVLGIAIYNGAGNLAYSRFTSIEKAIERGDWSLAWAAPTFEAPPSWEEMERTLGRFGNAMSQVRWEGGNPTRVWDEKTGDDLFATIVGGGKITATPPSETPLDADPGVLKRGLHTGKGKPASAPPKNTPASGPIPDLVDEIALLVETQPYMSDLTPAMGDRPYHKALADKIRHKFVSQDTRLAKTRVEADVYFITIGEILEAMCENQNVSTISPYDPHKRAPNFVLAQRLGIGRVFDMPNYDECPEIKPGP